jgi:transposase InsO family protein
MRGFDDAETAQTIMDGLRIYYNFVRPHTALNGKTPAQEAQIELDSKERWLSLIKEASRQRQRSHS